MQNRKIVRDSFPKTVSRVATCQLSDGCQLCVLFVSRRRYQGRLNQWAHWARAQGPRIFFLFEGPQVAVVKYFFKTNYLIVDATV